MMTASTVILLISLTFVSSSDKCGSRPFVIPSEGPNTVEQNIVGEGPCCDLCSDAEDATAFSYNRNSQECRCYYNNTEFVDETSNFIVSGLIYPDGYISPVVPETTTANTRCPDDYTGNELRWPHTQNCSMFIECNMGLELHRNCSHDIEGTFYDYQLMRCRSCQSVDCYPGAYKPPCDPDTTEEPGQSTTTRVPGESCQPNGTHLIPHREDCSKYIQCIDGVEVERSCVSGLLFDYIELRCVIAQDARCHPDTSTGTTTLRTTTSTMPPATLTTSTSNTASPNPGIDECPANGTENIPYPQDCGKYIQCIDGVGTERQCVAGLLFDYLLKRCTIAEEAICAPDTTNPSATTTVTTMATTTNTAGTTTTAPTSTARTTLPAPTSAPGECPPTGVENIPFPGDCQRYIQCTDGEPRERVCVSGLLFDHITKYCRIAADAACAPGSTAPPT